METENVISGRNYIASGIDFSSSFFVRLLLTLRRDMSELDTSKNFHTARHQNFVVVRLLEIRIEASQRGEREAVGKMRFLNRPYEPGCGFIFVKRSESETRQLSQRVFSIF